MPLPTFLCTGTRRTGDRPPQPTGNGTCPVRRRRDGEPNALPGPRRRVGGRAVPGTVAGEVAAAHPARRGAGLPVAGLLRGRCDRVLRHPVHRALSAGTVRLQRRRAALVMAGALPSLLWGAAPPRPVED